MNDISFFSSNSYIFLPTKNNPKVALCVDSSILAKNAFKLYNPFSSNAKKFKILSQRFFTTLNIFSKIFSTKKEKSDFSIYLEKLLGQPLIISLYFATVQDKVVLQLQSTDAKIIGYLKYPLNDIGIKRINNEIKAFDMLSKTGIVEPCILTDAYDNKPFLLLKELDGTVDRVEKKFIDSILETFKKEGSFILPKHPRIRNLKKQLLKNEMKEYINKLENISNNSTTKYKVVYEHGDFTPWNIIKVKDDYIPFDFEYLVEDGLEYLDMIKYYYQVGKLLEAKENKELYDFVSKEINILEFKKLFELFLIKEILRCKEENEPFDFEENMIKMLEKI